MPGPTALEWKQMRVLLAVFIPPTKQWKTWAVQLLGVQYFTMYTIMYFNTYHLKAASYLTTHNMFFVTSATFAVIHAYSS
jgi:hypothetical protein